MCGLRKRPASLGCACSRHTRSLPAPPPLGPGPMEAGGLGDVVRGEVQGLEAVSSGGEVCMHCASVGPVSAASSHAIPPFVMRLHHPDALWFGPTWTTEWPCAFHKGCLECLRQATRHPSYWPHLEPLAQVSPSLLSQKLGVLEGRAALRALLVTLGPSLGSRSLGTHAGGDLIGGVCCTGQVEHPVEGRV